MPVVRTDGRSVGRSVTWLPNFLGWVDLFTHGAPQARFARGGPLKFCSPRTRLLTIWHLRIFAIYLYLTFHIASYAHHLNIFFLFRIFIWEHTVQDLSPWQPAHSGILCHITLRIAPQCPFLKTAFWLSFLKKHFHNFFYNFLAISIFVSEFEAFFIFYFDYCYYFIVLLSAFELRGYCRYINLSLLTIIPRGRVGWDDR